MFKNQNSSPANAPITALNLQTKESSSPQVLSSPQIYHHNQSTIIIIDSPKGGSSSNHSISPDESQSCNDEDGDGSPCGGKAKKKVKPNSTQPTTTFGHFDNVHHHQEERDESTSCETSSEDENNNSNNAQNNNNTHHHHHPSATYRRDFFLSPMMHAEKGTTSLEDFNLDSNAINQQSPIFSHNNSSSDEDSSNLLYKQSKRFREEEEEEEGGVFCTGAGNEQQQCLKSKLKCKFNHQQPSNCELRKQKWCLKCEDLLKKCQNFAEENHGKCLNENYDEQIHFECEKGHRWKLNHKNARKRWCLDCLKLEKAERKKKCEKERAQRQKEEQECQQRLFDEARQKVLRDSGFQSQYNNNNSNNANGYYYNNSNDNNNNNNNHHQQHQQHESQYFSAQQQQSMVDYFARIDFQIQEKAKIYTNEFLSRKEFTGDISYQQVLQVIKILMMPEQVLQHYMMNLSPEMLKNEFRRIVKIIHPDKNKHPKAGSAFQKVYKVYEAARTRVEFSTNI